MISITTTKAEQLYRLIRDDILENKYAVGEIINEKDLAEKYEVSKTPVREALAMLVQDGILLKYPRMGYFIKEFDMGEYYELLQYRCILETGIAYYLMKKCSDEELVTLYRYTPKQTMSFEEWQLANRDFHLAMAKLSGNRFMYDSLVSVFNRTMRKTSYTGYKRLADDVHRDHRLIVDALLRRDYDEIRERIRVDLERTDEEDKLI